jgi:hypothetical protein
MEVLRVAYRSCRARLKGAKAATKQHLQDTHSTGGAGVPTGELERLNKLKQDHLAWLTYLKTGELPEHVLSEGMNVPLS